VAGQATARADYYPRLTADGYVSRLVNPSEITIPAGSFGTIEPIGRVPVTDTVLPQGLNGLVFANTTVGQPLTQLLKIRAANAIAAAERHLAEANLAKAEQEIRYAVCQVYYGTLVLQRQRDAAQASVRARQAVLRDAESAVASGQALEGTVMGARAQLLQEEYTVLEAENQIADLGAELAMLIGAPLGTEFQLAEPLNEAKLAPLSVYLSTALDGHPEVRAAQATVEKAESAIRAARYEFVPDVSAFARYTYQNGVPFLPSNNAAVGVQATWNIFDWGKRRSAVTQRELQLEQAKLNVQRIRERLGVDIDKAYRKATRAKRLMEVAEQALAAARENDRTVSNQVRVGFVTESKGAEAQAALSTAEFKATQSRIGYELAIAELDRIAGVLARQVVASTQPAW
jgi:outer membrane protein TolC